MQIIDNTQAQRFEIPVGDKFGFITYSREHGKLALLHTEVPEEAEGKGIASSLVKFAFEQAKQQQRKVLVFCPYISNWLKRNTEYETLVEKDYNI